jgi:hypothetical protein
MVDPNNTVQTISSLPTDQANPDQVVVGSVDGFDPTGTDTFVTVRVRNAQTNMISDPYILFVDDPVPGAPTVDSCSPFPDYLQPNSDRDLEILGENLLGVTEQSFSGIPGLTFSNIQFYPGVPPDRGFQVHVHADGSVRLRGDEASNLIITTPNGQSNPIWLPILPP